MLDESFSAIDKKTAKEIERNILLDQNRTIIAIAHTVSIDNIQLFDKIIVLDKGTIKEIGAPRELLNQPDSFIHSVISYWEDIFDFNLFILKIYNKLKYINCKNDWYRDWYHIHDVFYFKIFF